MKRKSFTIADLEKIANVMNAQFEGNFVLYNGEKISFVKEDLIYDF